MVPFSPEHDGVSAAQEQLKQRPSTIILQSATQDRQPNTKSGGPRRFIATPSACPRHIFDNRALHTVWISMSAEAHWDITLVNLDVIALVRNQDHDVGMMTLNYKHIPKIIQ